jgi:perosamine synthetase
MIPVFKPSLGKEEIDAVGEVLLSGWIGLGPKSLEFESQFGKFIGAKNTLATNSCTGALNLIVYSLIKSGDEVITPSFTFVATTNAIVLAGGKPVFADIDPVHLTLDPEDVARKITPKTKAIMVVHYGGQPANIEALTKLCKKHNLVLFEDCAHAIGAYYHGKHVGNFGDAAAFSFAAIKNITTGDGGMAVVKKPQQLKRLKLLAWSGIDKSTWHRSTHKHYNWQYNVKEVGWKYQMNDIAAAIGLVQLSKAKELNRRRREVAMRYQEAFKNISWLRIPVEPKDSISAFHNYYLLVSPSIRNRLIDHLHQHDIAATVHYYPNHLYPIFKAYYTKLPVSEKVYRQILNLPIYPDLPRQDQQRVIDAVLSFK